jgi:gamma-glutamyltranspeptidase
MVFHRNEETRTGALGKLVLVLGASGGPKIISAVLTVLTNYLFLGMPIYESVIRPRLHDQLIYHNAAATTVENSLLNQGPTINVPNITRASMMRRGHDLLDVNYQGTVQAIAIDTERHEGGLSAVCDVRKGGRPAGY